MTSMASLIEFVSTKAREHGFAEQRTSELVTAVKEALTATIEHAFKNKKGDITITCKIDRWDNLVVIIEDTGEAYNILLADAPFDDIPDSAKDRASSRMVKRLIDNIEYKILETRNVLTLTAGGKPRNPRG